MLDKNKVISNGSRYLKTVKSKNILTDELIEFLGSDLVNAPLSAHTEYLGAYEGGLIEHLLQVTKHMINVNNTLPENKRVDGDEIIRVGLIHQIGKVKLFIPCESEWHKTNQGKMYEYNDEVISLKTSERTILYLNMFNIKLNENEFQAIINFDKPESDLQSKNHTNKLGMLLKIGNYMCELEKK